MKTFKNALKLTAVLLMVFLASCKKDNNSTPTPNGDNGSLKGFYIAGKYTAESLDVPFAITLDDNAKAIINSGYIDTQGSYTYKNGTLIITYSDNSTDNFKISNNAIVSFSGVSSLKSYELLSLPATNQFNGNTYSGGLKTAGSNLFILNEFKFGTTQYGESSIGDPVINKDYTLINNAVAVSNTGNNGTLTFFLLLDGKMEVGRYTPTNANGNISISNGTYTKQ